MVRLILVAHAPLARALGDVAAHAFPEATNTLGVVDVEPSEGLDAVERRLRDLLGQEPGADALLLVDVFGATPCNAALKVADGVHVRVVCGVNVPMLWRALCYATEPLDRLVVRAVDGATQGVLQLSAARRQNQGPNLHGAKRDQDQQ